MSRAAAAQDAPGGGIRPTWAAALLLLIALLIAPPAVAQSAREDADRVMRAFLERDFGAFSDFLLSDTDLGQDGNTRTTLGDNRVRWVRFFQSLGAPADARYAGRRAYAPGLETLCYLVRYRRTPLLVALRYYERPEGRWMLANINWSSGTDMHSSECGGRIEPPSSGE